MAASNYDLCEQRVLLHEGGYTDNPSDPGGPTNYGITIYDYRKYVSPTANALDVKNMSIADAKRIYRTKYWAALNCDMLPAGVDDSVFDYGVNSGVNRAGKVLRRCVNLPDADWHVSAEVVDAARKRDPAELVTAINAERLEFLQHLPTWRVFGVGWGRRVSEVRVFDIRMASKQPPIQPTASTGVQKAGKGEIPNHPAKTITKVGGPLVALGSAQLMAWLNAHPAVIILGGLAVLGVTIFLIYKMNKAKQAQQEAPTPGLVPVPELKGA